MGAKAGYLDNWFQIYLYPDWIEKEKGYGSSAALPRLYRQARNCKQLAAILAAPKYVAFACIRLANLAITIAQSPQSAPISSGDRGFGSIESVNRDHLFSRFKTVVHLHCETDMLSQLGQFPFASDEVRLALVFCGCLGS